jgi:hypothetical protein
MGILARFTTVLLAQHVNYERNPVSQARRDA